VNAAALVVHLFRRAARLQRKRMALTVAAIAWGTISIVLLLSFGEGMKRALRRGQHGLGEGIMVVWPGETAKAFAGMPQGRAIQLLPEDVELLRRSVPAIGRASGEMRRWGVAVGYGRKLVNKPVLGVEPIFGELRAQVPEPGGRFINAVDEKLKRRVVFVGTDVAEELFGPQAKEVAVGQAILLNQVPFTVVGVMRRKIQMGMYGGPDVNTLVIPLSTFRTFFGRRTLGNLVFDPVTPERMEEARKGMFETLGAKYRFDPTDERALGLWDTQKNQRTMRNMTLGIQLFLGIIGGLTLLIGGVGVANIMYAAVKARSREIAIQMALGARGLYVMGPLVLESLALTLLGGLIGTAAGVGIVEGLALLQRRMKSEAMQFMGEPTFSLPIAVATVAILGTVGFFAGYFPSRRAVAIHPAETLRHD
jgi:putative ABC transport system permease protein